VRTGAPAPAWYSWVIPSRGRARAMLVQVAGAIVVLGLLLGTCSTEKTDSRTGPSDGGCRVTLPRPHPPVRLPHNPVVSNPGVPADAVGNEFLWVQVSRNGVFRVVRDTHDGAYWNKMPFWRLKPGELTMEAERLDGPGTFSHEAGTVLEYGPTGFVANTVTFSDLGCWRITGHVDGGSLTIVTRVVASNA
jgi:hypothetical protein